MLSTRTASLRVTAHRVRRARCDLVVRAHDSGAARDGSGNRACPRRDIGCRMQRRSNVRRHPGRLRTNLVEVALMPTKKSAGEKRTAVGPFETADRPEKIRNVALVGHSGSGKTTLVEALLAATGTITRAGTVAEGSTCSDSDPVEVAQQRSVALSVCPLEWDGVVVNLLDTPGYPDFTGELRAGLRAADAALFVVSAAEHIDPITVSHWAECASVGTPRAVVIARQDAPQADFAATVAACQQVFGGSDGQDVLPLYLPVGGGEEQAPTGLVG